MTGEAACVPAVGQSSLVLEDGEAIAQGWPLRSGHPVSLWMCPIRPSLHHCTRPLCLRMAGSLAGRANSHTSTCWSGERGGERFGSISRVHAAFDFVIPQPGIIQGKPDEPEADSRVRGSNRGFTYDAGGPETAQRAEGGGWAPRLRAQTRERCAAMAVS